MKKTIVFLLIFSVLSTFAGCRGENTVPDTLPVTETPVFSSPPEEEPETEAVQISYGEKTLGYVESEEILKSYISALNEYEKQRLADEGIDVISAELVTEFSVSECVCKVSELITPDTLILENIPDIPLSFRLIFLESEKIYEKPETVYKNSSSYYEGTSVTETEGVTGVKELTYTVTSVDGEEISRELTKSVTVTEKKNKVILIGTKKSTASTGSYAFPLSYMYITSPYGNRNLGGSSDFHLGLDLRAAVGTQVYASDGGKVIFAGYNSSYGYLVKIEHDSGDLTYYAHLSKINVKVGERVYKGQPIAKSGATGNVTGPHLHFEIRKNGKTVNPLSYLPKF